MATFQLPHLVLPLFRPLTSRSRARIKKRIHCIGVVEQGLEKARASIRSSMKAKNYSRDNAGLPQGAIYRNPYAFHRSHIEMVKRFKVWVCKEGNLPIFHSGSMSGMYAIEGHFISEITKPNSPFTARYPEEAHVFYIPISIVNVIAYVCNYKASTYKLLKGPSAPEWNKGFIRVLCNANTSEGFDPRRDATLPEINIFDRQISPPDHPKFLPWNKSILAFFAGGNHGPVRPILFQHWGNYSGNDVVVYEHVPKGVDYADMLKESKFCLCLSGYDVASPRVVGAINAGCVPVIISKAYVLPFSDMIDWSKISIEIPMERISELRTILQGVSTKKYLMLYKIVLQVQKHFVINVPSQKYDVFHDTSFFVAEKT